MAALLEVRLVPSVSKKQHNLMAMVANDPAAAKRVGIPQSVGEEYMQADKGKKIKGADRSRPDLQKVNKPTTRQGQGELFAKGGVVNQLKESTMATKQKYPTPSKMGAVKTAAPSRDGVAVKGKTKGTNVKMAGAKNYKRGGAC
jgi:hypothetical protein